MAEKYPCSKEAEIAEIHTELKMIKTAVMGNGKEGLIIEVPRLSQATEQLNEICVGLQTGMSGFLKYQQTQEGIQQGKSYVKRSVQWLIGILVTVILALGGIIVRFILIAHAS